MKKVYILVIILLLLPAASLSAQNQDDSSQNREYKIKAAFLYNFIKFVDWPMERDVADDENVVIGIIGKNPFGDAFEPIQNKKVKGNNTTIKYFQGFKELKQIEEDNSSKYENIVEEIKNCHLLFICSSEKNNLVDILTLVKDHNILTVGETPKMLEKNGIINFVLEENKVRFEINLIAARESKLVIRSQLLRLAKNVIDNK
jgi:hypothetical protein